MAGCETGSCDCPKFNGRTYHRGNCWPVYDAACRIDPAKLKDIDPNYGGPTRDDVINRKCPMCGNRSMF